MPTALVRGGNPAWKMPDAQLDSAIPCLSRRSLVNGHCFDGRRLATGLFWGLVFTLAGSVAFALVGCRRPGISADNILIHEEIHPQPVRVGEVTVAIRVADAEANPVTDASIMVEADMTHPGMSPVFAAAKEKAPGTYESKMNFAMGGDWVVLLHIQLGNGTRIERQMDVRGVLPN
jgi:hypothetical protein